MSQAFDLAVQPGAIRIVVKTDAMLLEQAMNRKEPDLSRYAVPIEDLKTQAARLCFFSSCAIRSM